MELLWGVIGENVRRQTPTKLQADWPVHFQKGYKWWELEYGTPTILLEKGPGYYFAVTQV